MSENGNGVIDIGRRETVVDAVARGLIRYIAENGLRAGDKLPSERELVAMVGVSRLPLREALCILKGLGIVEARHGKGVFVKPLDMASIFGMLSPLLRTQADIEPKDILQTRVHFEPMIAALAAENRDQEDITILRDCLEQMKGTLDNKNVFIKHDMAFHEQLASATGNPVFHVFMAALTDLLRQVQFMYPDREGYRECSVRFHTQILAAIETQDSDAARAAMQDHIHDVEERI